MAAVSGKETNTWKRDDLHNKDPSLSEEQTFSFALTPSFLITVTIAIATSPPTITTTSLLIRTFPLEEADKRDQKGTSYKTKTHLFFSLLLSLFPPLFNDELIVVGDHGVVFVH